MKASYGIFATAALASAVFLACTPEKPSMECIEDPDSCSSLHHSSDAGNEEQPYSSESTPTPSSASDGGTSSIAAGVSSSVARSSSSALPSSSSRLSSSSAAATAACVVRTNGMPTNPTSTCFRGEGNSAGKCYICPSDVNCTNSGFWSNWAWDNAWPSQGWITEVACGTSSGTSSQSSGGTSSAQAATGDNSYTTTSGRSGSGKTTRYWDACKASCGWPNNAGGSPNGTARSCSVNGSTLSDNNAQSSCSGGSAYTCMYQAPWAVNDNLAFGFAASHTNSDCGKCYELTFTITQKKMVVMISNIGSDVDGDQFDIMIPGGGVGQFNALSTQVSQNGGSSSNLGAQYGGFRTTCQNQGGDINTCVQNMCNSTFSSAALSNLKAGCSWYVNWLRSGDNPNVNFVSVNCPKALVDRYNGTKTTYGGQ